MRLTERRKAAKRFVPLLVNFLARLNQAYASFEWRDFSLAGKNPLYSPVPA